MDAQTRREKAAEAYKLWVHRETKVEIGKKLGLTRQTIATLIKEEKLRVADDRAKEDERAKSISTHEAVIHYGWSLLLSEELKVNSLNQSGVMNSIIAAQKAIDDITGAKAPIRSEQDVNVTYRESTTGAELEQLFSDLDAYVSEVNGGHQAPDSSERLDTENTNH